MPNWLEFSLTTALPWLELGVECALAILIGLLVHSLLHRIARRVASGFVVAHSLVVYGRRPMQLLLPLLLLQIVAGDAPETLLRIHLLRHLLSIALLATLTYLCLRLVNAVAEAVIMTFPGVRQIGASLLASAGVAGLVASIAARPVLGNLIAGLHIALTQPIRIDDVLIVDGEWGKVEEVTGSYVVVRIWDERRLIVPLEWFIQHPFQNWTRSASQLTGTVFLWVDYAMPLEPLRQELERVCRAAAEWDGRVCLLQVTNTTERAMRLRALVSASDASRAWDLRCRVREALVVFVQQGYADYLPRQRVSFDNIAEDARVSLAQPTCSMPG